MDTSETYVKMRLAAILDMGMGIPLEGPCNYIVDDVWVDSGGNWYYSTEHEHCQLERQDQLQEMYRQEHEGALAILGDFAYAALEPKRGSSYHYRGFTSMEQLWLAFVMKERYNKIWINGEWETTK